MNTFNPILIIFWVILGSITAYFAQKKGKNPYLWFTIGSLLGLVGLAILFFISAREKKKVFMFKRPHLKKPLSEMDIFFTKPDNLKKLWYYLDNDNKQFGPVSLDWLRKKWDDDVISSSSYVWHEELDNWKKIQDFFPKKVINKKK
jgi:hypothetical protein